MKLLVRLNPSHVQPVWPEIYSLCPINVALLRTIVAIRKLRTVKVLQWCHKSVSFILWVPVWAVHPSAIKV